ncbi:DUF4153 domain-containing protein [Streptomyces sp. wa22]|uniref:DUF4153 domain-containing protein n=1 Tax=Streptomyces sp. wa22 TaxID=1828244 RepID=UPI0039677A4D
MGPGTLWSVFATALLSALLLGDGLGLNLLIVAVPAALGAYFAARSARRRLRPWTAVWALGGLALLAIPALRDAGWPVFLAMVSALALGSLALHGSRSWPGVLLGSVGLLPSVAGGARWGWRGVRARADDSRGRVRTVARTTAVAVVLLIVFGALFASADAAFADLLGSLTPDVSIGDSPWRVFLFVLGLLGALAAAYSAAAPVRWDGITVRPGTARNRAEHRSPGHCQEQGRGGVRARADDSRGRVRTVARTTAVAVVLLIVFGALFASADAAFADLLGSLTPDVSIGDSPWRVFLFVLGLLGALAAAYSAAAPVRWDGITVRPGTARNRAEWALPLIVLNLLFAVFIGLQLVVLLGGYDKVLEETGLKPAEYARQGFWQLLWATVLTLIVIALALRWAPRGRAGDRTLVRSVLGLLCVLTLVVVASALRRMDLYVDAFGLTRLRISVAAVELWLGVVLVLILAAGVFGARLLPRAVVGSAAVGVLAFGLISPDGLIAEQNVQRHRSGGTIDIEYLKGLSADAVPALNELPEPLRSCALENFQRDFALPDAPWYATSWGEARAREVIEEHPAESQGAKCYDLGRDADERDGYEEEDSYDPY